MKQDENTIFPLLARIGHRLGNASRDEDALELLTHFYDEDIEKYEMNRLSTIHDILNKNSPINDIVMLNEIKKYGLDYDYKREILLDGSTKPHETVNDFKRYRAVLNTLHEKKKVRGTPKFVKELADRAKQGVRSRGSSKDDCVRHFCRALVQGIHPFNSNCGKYKYIENRLLKDFNVTVDKLKNANRVPFADNVIFNTTANRSSIRKMLKLLGYESENNYEEWIELLINKGLSNPVTMFNAKL